MHVFVLLAEQCAFSQEVTFCLRDVYSVHPALFARVHVLSYHSTCGFNCSSAH